MCWDLLGVDVLAAACRGKRHGVDALGDHFFVFGTSTTESSTEMGDTVFNKKVESLNSVWSPCQGLVD